MHRGEGGRGWWGENGGGGGDRAEGGGTKPIKTVADDFFLIPDTDCCLTFRALSSTSSKSVYKFPVLRRLSS